MEIPIIYDDTALKFGVKKKIYWKPQEAPHVIVIGSTGAGKTYFSKILLGKIVKYAPDSQLFICDFKGDSDFNFLNGCDRFCKPITKLMLSRVAEKY